MAPTRAPLFLRVVQWLRLRFIPGICGAGNLHIAPGVKLRTGARIDARAGPVRIDRQVTIGRRVTILTGASNLSIHDPTAGVRIGAGARLGEDCLLLPGACIGEGAWLAPYSVVAGPIAPHTIAAGSPARTIGRRSNYQLSFDPAPTPDAPTPSGIDNPPVAGAPCRSP